MPGATRGGEGGEVEGRKDEAGLTEPVSRTRTSTDGNRSLTSDLGVVSHADAAFIIVCLHGDFSSAPGPMSEGGHGKHTQNDPVIGRNGVFGLRSLLPSSPSLVYPIYTLFSLS